MTISNIVSPLMVYADRFLIGAVISVAAVAYYATPYEMVTKLWIVPNALAGVLFPAFAASVSDRVRAASLLQRGVKYSAIVLFPIVLVLVAFGYEVLGAWLGKTFAEQSSFVLRWLAVGVFVNSIAQIPFALVQGLGRPDLTAKLHLIELPLYVAALLWLLHLEGINGAAIAWTIRVTVDMALLFAVASKFVSLGGAAAWKMLAPLGLFVLAFALVSAQSSGTSKLIFVGGALVAFAVASWFVMLSPEERDWITNKFGSSTAG